MNTVHSAYLAGSAFKKFSLGNLNFLHACLPRTDQLTMCYKVKCYHPLQCKDFELWWSLAQLEWVTRIVVQPKPTFGTRVLHVYACIYMRIYLHYMHFLIENNKVDQVQQRSLKKTTDFALNLRAFPLFIPIVLALMCCWYVLLLMCCWCVSLDMALPLPRLLLGHRSIEGRLSNTATPSPTICSWRWSCCCNTLKQTIILSC